MYYVSLIVNIKISLYKINNKSFGIQYCEARGKCRIKYMNLFLKNYRVSHNCSVDDTLLLLLGEFDFTYSK